MHEPAALDHRTSVDRRRNFVFEGERDDRFAMHLVEDVAESQQPAISVSRKCGHYRLDPGVVVARRVTHRDAEGLGRVLHGPQHATGIRRSLGIVENRHGHSRWGDLGEHLQLFCVYRRIVAAEAGGVAAGTRQTLHVAHSYRVADEGEHNRNRFCLLLDLLDRGIAPG